jgi:hypothetical protein
MSRFQPVDDPLPGLETGTRCRRCNRPVQRVWTREPLAQAHLVDDGRATRREALTAIAHSRGGALLASTDKRARGQGTTTTYIRPTPDQYRLDTANGYTWRRIHHCDNPPLTDPHPGTAPDPGRWPDQPPF